MVERYQTQKPSTEALASSPLDAIPISNMSLNSAYFYGQVLKRQLYKKRDAETFHKCVIIVNTLSRYRNGEQFDAITVMTENREMIDFIKDNLNDGDMVHIKGMICTADVNRKCICSECGAVYRDKGYTCYIHPIHIQITEHQLTEDEGQRLIASNVELSNEVIVDGHVCTIPNYSEQYHSAGYKLAVKRPFYVLEDPVEKKVDYPAINTYHEQADMDGKSVRLGTRMNVKGSVRVRDIEKKVTCPECGNEEMKIINVLEIVASHVGYTNNWDKPEENDDVEIIINTELPESDANDEAGTK